MSRPTISRALQAARRLHSSTPLDPIATPLASSSTAGASTSSSRLPPLLPPTLAASTSLPESTTAPSALSLIASQSTPSTGRYLLARLHSRTYLLHPRDILTVPQLRPAPPVGSTLGLTRILEVGSRDWSVRSPAASGKVLRKMIATPSRDAQGAEVIGNAGEVQVQLAEGWEKETIPEHVATCELTVIEHTKSPLERIVKSKRRKGYKKTIEHKQGWTRLRVGDIHLGDGHAVVKSEGEVGLS